MTTAGSRSGTDPPPVLSVIEASKRLAAWTAVDRHVRPEYKVRFSFAAACVRAINASTGHRHRFWYTHTSRRACTAVLIRFFPWCPGSTVPYVVERIVAQGRDINRDRVFIPTGFQSKELIVNAKLRLGDVDQYPVIDVTIDGADE